MKVESPQIDRSALGRLLEAQYGLQATRLTFVPQGEESYSYILQTDVHSRHFIKVSPASRQLGERYEATHGLYAHCGLGFVVAPHATQAGAYCVDMGEYAVAVFDFVEGVGVAPDAWREETWRQMACLTAALHQSVSCPSLPSLPVAPFALEFEEWLLRVLDAADGTTPLAHACEREARALLAQEKPAVLAALAQLKELARRAQAAATTQVVTHGDLKPENFLLDDAGCLRLIDWTKLALAPPERDLVNFLGDRFEELLESYLACFAIAPRLQPALFAFYSEYLRLWAVADYGSWVLLEDADLVEKEFARDALQQQLPPNGRTVQVEEIRVVLERLRVAG